MTTGGCRFAREKLLRQELARFIDIVTQQMHPECIILLARSSQGRLMSGLTFDLVVIVHTDLPFHARIKQVLRCVHPQAGMDVLVYTRTEWAEMTSVSGPLSEKKS